MMNGNMAGLLMDGPTANNDDMNYVVKQLELLTQWLKKKYNTGTTSPYGLEENQPFHPNGGGLMDYTNNYNVFMARFGRSTP